MIKSETKTKIPSRQFIMQRIISHFRSVIDLGIKNLSLREIILYWSNKSISHESSYFCHASVRTLELTCGSCIGSSHHVTRGPSVSFRHENQLLRFNSSTPPSPSWMSNIFRSILQESLKLSLLYICFDYYCYYYFSGFCSCYLYSLLAIYLCSQFRETSLAPGSEKSQGS